MLDAAMLDREWRAACESAELSPNICTLYSFPGDAASADADPARLYDPGFVIPDDDDMFRVASLRAEANSDENRERYRIGVWVDDDRALLGARLRHELEHVRQWLALGPALFGLYQLLRREVLEHKAGGLAGAGGLYLNAMPSEQDANAAAARYIEGFHSTERERLLKSELHRALVCSNLGPEPIETLPRRNIAFAAQFPTSCAAVAEAWGEDSFGRVLDRAVRMARLNHSMRPPLDHLFNDIYEQWKSVIGS